MAAKPIKNISNLERETMIEGYCQVCGEEEWLYECEQCCRCLCVYCYGHRTILVVCSECLAATPGQIASCRTNLGERKQVMTVREYLIAYLTAYPEDIFPPVSHTETQPLGGLSDRIAAHQSRIILRQMLKDLDDGIFTVTR